MSSKRIDSLVWKMKRFRVMSLIEVLYRISQKLFSDLELIKIKFGWIPDVVAKPGSAGGLISGDSCWKDHWIKNFDLDQVRIKKIANNKIELFGSNEYDLGNSIKWNMDPISKILTPEIYGKLINYRNDSIVGDIKLVWEIGRHQHLVPLIVAYVVSGDIRYKDAVIKQIESWINENPYATGIHWCSSLELSLRMISWAMVHSILLAHENNDGLFDAVEDRKKLGRCIYLHINFISGYLSKYSSANNHLIGELTGIWVTCQVFDLGKQGKIWREKSKKMLVNEFSLQVFKDGVNKEQAIYYHYWVLEYALFCYVVSRRYNDPFQKEFTEQIPKMAQFIRDISNKKYEPPQIGDADDGVVLRFDAELKNTTYKDILNSVDKVFDTSFIHDDYLCQKALFYSAVASNDTFKESITNDDTSDKDIVIYPNGGYAVLNTVRVKVVFDAGNLGYQSIAAHGHADALSFSVSIDDEWLLIDPGTYSYHKQPDWREYFKSTRAHNTIEIDNMNQSTYGGSFLWLNHHNATITDFGEKSNDIFVCGEHDGYQSISIVHKRMISLNKVTNQLSIVDRIIGSGWHRIRTFYHFAPEISVSRDQTQTASVKFSIQKENKTRMIMSVDNQLDWKIFKGEEEPIVGWYSRCLAIKDPCFTIVGEKYVELPIKITSNLVI